MKCESPHGGLGTEESDPGPQPSPLNLEAAPGPGRNFLLCSPAWHLGLLCLAGIMELVYELDSWNFSFFVVACSRKLLSLLQEWSAPAGNLLFPMYLEKVSVFSSGVFKSIKRHSDIV